VTLFRPEAFEPLTKESWNAGRVADAIRAIVADTDQALRGPKLFWKADSWDNWQATSPMKNLYVGTAGVLWALDGLRRRGHAESKLDLADLALHNVELFRARPDIGKWVKLPGPPESGFMTGESGILLVAFRLAPSSELADDLLARVLANVESDVNEVMWGAPGTLIAARLMHEWTGEDRWRAARDQTLEAVWSRREDDGFWVHRLYGREERGLTPPHGLVGNVQALRPVLDAERRSELERDTNAVLLSRAVIEGGLANWPPARPPHAAGPRRADPSAVVRGRTGDRRLGVGLHGRGAPAGGRGAHVAHRAEEPRQGTGHLPRHGRERLRVPEGLRADR
jgi:hypothetical protein